MTQRLTKLEQEDLDAEKITGESYKDSDLTTALGFLLMSEHVAATRATLEEIGDTHHNITPENYITIIENYGFIKVLEEKFVDPGYHDNPHTETLYIFAHPDGLLLSFDTYLSGKTVNSGHVYYNVRFSDDNQKEFFRSVSSGGCSQIDNNVWVGHHDCREALIRNMERLQENGEFVTPWVERPFLWLLHYMDTKDTNYDYKRINAERISRLPEWVRDFIG